MSDVGLLIFGQNGGPTSNINEYDSRRPRLQASLDSNPPHLALLDNFKGGTALVSNVSVIQREVLARIPHVLKYTPECLVYFYTKSYKGSITDDRVGAYNGGVCEMPGNSIAIEDKIFFECDATELRIVHTLQDFGGFSPYTSEAPSYIFRIKYYILSNDSHVHSYDYQNTLS